MKNFVIGKKFIPLKDFLGNKESVSLLSDAFELAHLSLKKAAADFEDNLKEGIDSSDVEDHFQQAIDEAVTKTGIHSNESE